MVNVCYSRSYHSLLRSTGWQWRPAFPVTIEELCVIWVSHREREEMKEHPTSRRSFLKYGMGTLGAVSMLPLILDGCGPTKSSKSSTSANGATITLKMSSSLTLGVNSAHWVWYNKFQQALDQKTGGRIKIQYFPNNQLG